MCGVFGYVSRTGAPVNLEILATVARVTEQRGPHAFGFAWVDARGRMRMFKQSGRVSDHLGLLRMAADARWLVGHCRWATHGSPENNLNNHPHPCDGGWLVHNGVVSNYRELADDYSVPLVTECDSEVLCGMIEFFDGELVDRCMAAASLVERPLVTLGLWPGRVVAVRKGNPLSIGGTKAGWYLGSLPQGLPANRIHVPDDSAVVFAPRADGEVRTAHYPLEAIELV